MCFIIRHIALLYKVLIFNKFFLLLNIKKYQRNQKFIYIWTLKLKTMKTKLFFFASLCFAMLVQAQYTTPNTGVDWTIDDIATVSPTTITISGSEYTLHEDLIVAADDTFRIHSDITLKITDNVLITVFGTFITNSEVILITAADQNAPYRGFRFEEFSNISIEKTIIEYGNGLQVLTEDFNMINCVLQNNVSLTSTGSVVNLSRGIVNIMDNEFKNNSKSAIGSAANASVSGNIIGNVIEYNNHLNTNRPQINMGPTRSDAPLRIIGNEIIGDRDFNMVGGISIANLVGGTIIAEIENNKVKDNRYGITIIGPNANVLIKDNIIEDNDTQGNPMLGGSGINLNSSTGGQNITLTGNKIYGNLWGITIQNNQNADTSTININLGDDENNIGENRFLNNVNEGNTYALYNNGPATIIAKHNCWIDGQDITLAQAENVIFHQIDDSALGQVIFDPLCTTFTTSEFSIDNFTFYPNPTKNSISFNNTSYQFEKVYIIDIQGKRVFEQDLSEITDKISFDLSQGMYFVKFINNNNTITKKLVIK